MKQDIDIVDDIFSRVKQILGAEFKGDIEIRLKNEEDKVRQSWGGTEPYVAKKKNSKEIKAQALSDLCRGVPVKDVIRKRGISRTEVYRLLKKK